MALYRKAANVPVGTVDMRNTSFRTMIVHGSLASLMVAERPAGYHSRPHTHDCEQLNWVQDGKLQIFVEDRAYHLEPGDVLRIPPGVVHWSWNRLDVPCTLVEVHAPGLHNDPDFAEFAVGLLGPDEEAVNTNYPVNEWVDLPDDEVTRIEQSPPADR